MRNEGSTTPQDPRELIREAGRPPEIPSEDLLRIRSAARREWQELSATPIFEGRSRSLRYAALAATLLIALGALSAYLAMRPWASTELGGTIELASGSGVSSWRVGDSVALGDRVRTEGDGRLALRLTSGHSVRLDSDSSLALLSQDALVLDRGAVYVDSGVQEGAPGLTVMTPAGSVREIGTQFEVRLSDASEQALEVRVREGRISLERDGESFEARQGERLVVSHGRVERGVAPVHGDSWSWVLATAPPLGADDRTLAAFLDWFGHEAGLEVAFENPELERSEAREIVSGDFSDMTPADALDAALSASGLRHRIEGGLLIVSR